MAMAMSEVQRIEDQLARAFGGDSWHGDPLLKILGGIKAEQAASHSVTRAHSIWEIVLHITFTEGIMRRRIKGEDTRFDEGEDWPFVRGESEEDWHEALARLEASHQELRETISQLSDDQLDSTVVGRDYSLYVLLHGLVQHLVYHAGQIALLKKSLI